MAKYLFITGGVVSSLGKGITAASVGRLLINRGLKIRMLKLDPYLNVDPGTMSPYQHGEVYVTDDGAETDLDLGHYERFLDSDLSLENNITAGSIYKTIIDRERAGGYLGGTVQVIPHVTDEIKTRMRQVGDRDDLDVLIIEIGGTVGDIESLPFLEAIRQLRLDLPPEDTLVMHLTYVPFIRAAQELKSKPTQHSVRELREIGLQPEILLCRSEMGLTASVREKIALFSNVHSERVIEALDVETIYEVPLRLHEGHLDSRVLDILHLEAPEPDLTEWREMVAKIKTAPRECTVAVVGKYTHLQDAYKSIKEAILHGGVANDARVAIRWVDSEELERRPAEDVLDGVDAVLVPGGFGDRGIEGKIKAVTWARTRDVPYLGICLGLQVATIEYARNVCGLTDANSSEFDASTPHPVIDLMPDQEGHEDRMGGTMRLGSYPCRLEPNSLAREAYGVDSVGERHRHRWEFSNDYRDKLRENGVRISGVNPERDLVEIWEIPEHPWFVAVQFHPELKSRPNRPHPLFTRFVRAALDRSPRTVREETPVAVNG